MEKMNPNRLVRAWEVPRSLLEAVAEVCLPRIHLQMNSHSIVPLRSQQPVSGLCPQLVEFCLHSCSPFKDTDSTEMRRSWDVENNSRHVLRLSIYDREHYYTKAPYGDKRMCFIWFYSLSVIAFENLRTLRKMRFAVIICYQKRYAYLCKHKNK